VKVLSANEVGQQAAGQAGGMAKKAGSKALNKAVGKAGKYLKKLLMKFLKQLIMSLLKMIISFIGPWGLVIIIAVFLVLAILSAIPFSDWFLGGNARSDTQKNADIKYEQKFKAAADATVAELKTIEADASWKNDVIDSVKPSWGIPSALVRYQIVVNKKKVELADYDPSKLTKTFAPSYTYTSIKDDEERIKHVTYCTYPTADGGSTTVGPLYTYDNYNRPAHNVLSKISFDYGLMDIKPLKRYYPGATLARTDNWDFVDNSSSGYCSSANYKQYEHTTVDDRYVPTLNIDGEKFQQLLVKQGIKKDEMKMFYEFIHTADTKWNPLLYGGKLERSGIFAGEATVTALVSRYEPLIRKYAVLYGIEAQVPLIMALIQQESGGRYLDVMQSSESLGLPPNTITDPEVSIQAGVDHFAKVLQSAGGDVKLTLQSYNFGGGFIPYALARGGYSKETAVAFSEMKAKEKKWDRYGDVDYVDHVMRYFSAAITSEGQKFDVQKVLSKMQEYYGLPYVWGGKTPEAGGFDCSGLMAYAFKDVGIDLTGNAESQYNKTVSIPESDARPGDLVFWSTYKDAASHVGMYIGNDKFVNSNEGGGVSTSSVERWKGYAPFLGFRRIQ
jgi:cell wall-associated NlpC family hydrolase